MNLRMSALVLLVVGCGVGESGEVGVRRDGLTLFSTEAEVWASGANAAVPVSDASNGLALRVGTLSTGLSPGAVGTGLVLRTRTENCPAGATTLNLSINGGAPTPLTVSGTTWVSSLVALTLPPSFLLTATNTYQGNCRVLVDTLAVEGPTAPPQTSQLVVEAESATGAGTVAPPYRRFTTDGAATATFSAAGALTQLAVTAAGVRCDATHLPRLVLSVDGVVVIDQAVTAATTLFAPLSLPAGSHSVTFAYAGDFNLGRCDASLSVDRAIFTVVH